MDRPGLRESLERECDQIDTHVQEEAYFEKRISMAEQKPVEIWDNNDVSRYQSIFQWVHATSKHMIHLPYISLVHP
jgi:hypothetical protein